MAAAVAAGAVHADAGGVACGTIWRSARSTDPGCDGPMMARAVIVAALLFLATVTAAGAWATRRSR